MKGHAAHNEAACDLLHKADDFPDWVITTAFYAAMHGVYEQLFPLKEADITYPTFEAYYSRKFARMPAGDKPNKHDATVDLVRVHLPAVASNYRLLKDSCFNARYRNYVVKPYEATIARNQRKPPANCILRGLARMPWFAAMSRSERSQAMLAHVESWKISGKSRKQYCMEQGLNPHTMAYWCAKSRKAAAYSGFAPVELTTGGAPHGAEVCYPNGVRLLLPQGTSMADVAAFVRLY